MGIYYSDILSARNLERCYEIAPPRIRQYLTAEIDFVMKNLKPDERVLELGCGYGRVLGDLLKVTQSVVGIDTALGSLLHGGLMREIQLAQMDAQYTGFQDNSFDVVVCIQNGISAFKVDPIDLVRESLRIKVDRGVCLFSSYSDKIWEERLEWFKLQAEERLLGELDWEKIERGTIVCKDGFVSTTFSEADFREIAHKLDVPCEITEVDSSSLFGIFY